MDALQKFQRAPARPIAALLLLLAFAGSLFFLRTAGEAASPPQVESAIEQNSIGNGYMNQYLYNEATGAFRKALAADPSFHIARVNLGIALLYKQDYDEALITLQDAIRRQAKDPFAHYALGLLHKNNGEHEKAAQHFSEVAALDPRDPASFYNLGVLMARLRKNSEAESALRRCLELEPANTSALYNLGTLLIKSGRGEEGTRLLESFRALQQKGEGASIGNQYGEMGNYALARNYQPVFTPASISPRPSDARAPFRDGSVEAGLDSLVLARPAAVSPAGGGVALSDLDGDGDIDAIVTRFEPGPNSFRALVLRNDGKGRFADVSASSGIQERGMTSAALGDYDNDGLPDLFLASGGDLLFRNLGQCRFQNVTKEAGLITGVSSNSGTFVDYDHDGDLDLYACSTNVANRMYRNNGNGTFADVTDTLGVGGRKLGSIGLSATDFDNDRDIDLVVLSL
ncbi:MAG: FG-GAP-like repeat-containing protein, partial [Gammaproteobacteria bacterium]